MDKTARSLVSNSSYRNVIERSDIITTDVIIRASILVLLITFTNVGRERKTRDETRDGRREGEKHTRRKMNPEMFVIAKKVTMKARERKNHTGQADVEGIGCDASVVVVFVGCHDGCEQKGDEGARQGG